MFEAFVYVLMVLAIIWFAIAIASSLPKLPTYTPLVALLVLLLFLGLYFTRVHVTFLR